MQVKQKHGSPEYDLLVHMIPDLSLQRLTFFSCQACVLVVHTYILLEEQCTAVHHGYSII